jgi:hypothetical protein
MTIALPGRSFLDLEQAKKRWDWIKHLNVGPIAAVGITFQTYILLDVEIEGEVKSVLLQVAH